MRVAISTCKELPKRQFSGLTCALSNPSWRGRGQLQRLCDRCSIEIFINQGGGVMTSCNFPTEEPIVIFNGNAELCVRH
nr:GH32 C-terminal domain-containing protein [Yersinia aleksiciae]